MVLSTEDYREFMQNIAAKSGAKFSLIPPIPNISSETTIFDQSQVEKIDTDRGLLRIFSYQIIFGQPLASS